MAAILLAAKAKRIATISFLKKEKKTHVHPSRKRDHGGTKSINAIVGCSIKEKANE